MSQIERSRLLGFDSKQNLVAKVGTKKTGTRKAGGTKLLFFDGAQSLQAKVGGKPAAGPKR